MIDTSILDDGRYELATKSVYVSDDEVNNIDSYRFDFAVFYEEERVAYINGLLFNEHTLKPEQMIEYAEIYGDEEKRELTRALVHTSEFNKDSSDIFESNKWSGYIDKLYVEEEHRRQGIGKFFLNNIHVLLAEYSNIKTRCLMIDPSPFDYESFDDIDDDELDDIYMEKQSIALNALFECGYADAGELAEEVQYFNDEYDNELLYDYFIKTYAHTKTIIVEADPVTGTIPESFTVILAPGETLQIITPEGCEITGLETKKIKPEKLN